MENLCACNGQVILVAHPGCNCRNSLQAYEGLKNSVTDGALLMKSDVRISFPVVGNCYLYISNQLKSFVPATFCNVLQPICVLLP